MAMTLAVKTSKGIKRSFGSDFRKRHSLTTKQERFLFEYMIDMNGTAAAIRAGYNGSGASVYASVLLSNPRIDAALQELQAAAAKRLCITADRVLAEMARVAFANMDDYMSATKDGDPVLDFSQLDRNQTAALQEVTVEDYVDGRGEDARDVKRVKFRLHDKVAALRDLGKHLGLFPDRHEFTGANGTPLAPPVTNITFVEGGPGVPVPMSVGVTLEHDPDAPADPAPTG